MTTKLFVGNIQWSIGEDELGRYFSKVGEVIKATIIVDRNTGRSRGFGFVEMASPGDAEKAIAALNGSYLGNRQILVNEAKPEEPKNQFTETQTPPRDFISLINDFMQTAQVGEKQEWEVGLEFYQGPKKFFIIRDS